MSDALLDRMSLQKRLPGIAADVRNVAALPDPVGKTFDARTLDNGLRICRRRTPLGVLGVIYEARPNVTVDVIALALKSGNAVIMRGGKEILRSNMALVKVIRQALADAGLNEAIPADAIQYIESTDRRYVDEMLKLHEYIDMIIPRGGAALHQHCRENSTIPVITGGLGICHVYVDATAKLDDALAITYNAKTQRPSVCNSLDTVLVHRAGRGGISAARGRALGRGGRDLPRRAARAGDRRRARGCSARRSGGFRYRVDGADPRLESGRRAGRSDRPHSPAQHAALRRDHDRRRRARAALRRRSRFGGGVRQRQHPLQRRRALGLGAEIAVSTQKLHARGPMALEELTTYKWVVIGSGQVRP